MKARQVICSLALAAICSSSNPIDAASRKPDICEQEMSAAARRHAVPLGMLYAVGMTESGRRGALHPFALNIAGKSVFAKNRADGERHVRRARKSGVRLIDIGCMQINHHYHGDAFASVRQMFDPRKNVDYAARFLKDLRAREGSWTMAVARYHAGPNNNPAQKRYVCAVIRNLVLSGFGKWTGNARRFCRQKNKK